MLNSLCRCFYFWQENDDERNSDLDRISTLQRPEVCLDVTRSGNSLISNLVLKQQ